MRSERGCLGLGVGDAVLSAEVVAPDLLQGLLHALSDEREEVLQVKVDLQNNTSCRSRLAAISQ